MDHFQNLIDFEEKHGTYHDILSQLTEKNKTQIYILLLKHDKLVALWLVSEEG